MKGLKMNLNNAPASVLSINQDSADLRQISPLCDTFLAEHGIDAVQGEVDWESARSSKAGKFSQKVPLITPEHVRGGNYRKPLRVPSSDHIGGRFTLLDPTSCVCILSRENTNGLNHRLCAAPINPADFKGAGFALDHRLIMLAKPKGESFDSRLNAGVIVYMNSSIVAGYLKVRYGNMLLVEDMLRELPFPNRENLYRLAYICDGFMSTTKSSVLSLSIIDRAVDLLMIDDGWQQSRAAKTDSPITLPDNTVEGSSLPTLSIRQGRPPMPSSLMARTQNSSGRKQAEERDDPLPEPRKSKDKAKKSSKKNKAAAREEHITIPAEKVEEPPFDALQASEVFDVGNGMYVDADGYAVDKNGFYLTEDDEEVTEEDFDEDYEFDLD